MEIRKKRNNFDLKFGVLFYLVFAMNASDGQENSSTYWKRLEVIVQKAVQKALGYVGVQSDVSEKNNPKLPMQNSTIHESMQSENLRVTDTPRTSEKLAEESDAQENENDELVKRVSVREESVNDDAQDDYSEFAPDPRG